jgi:hypothetical protein
LVKGIFYKVKDEMRQLQKSILPNFRERARARTRTRKSELFKLKRFPIHVSANLSPYFRARARSRN